MKKISVFYLLLTICFITGCVTSHSYYLSPLDINSNYYKTIPLKSDSVKAATYANIALTGGISNYKSRDNLYAFHGSIHRSHNFGKFQAYYGGGLALGSYYAGKYDGYNETSYRNDTIIRMPASNNFFGAYGFHGGMNLALPLPREGEWRIGFEASIQNEFGNYLNFRKSLVDSAINILATNSWTKTIGATTEFVWKRRRSGTLIGYKISFGGSIISPATYLGDERTNGPFYFSNTLHLTKRNTTFYWQINFGNHTSTFQTGVNCRLGKNKKNNNSLK